MTEIPEQTARFDVPGLTEPRDGMDLANAVNALSGVAHVAVDGSGKTLSVTFDPAYVNRQMIEDTIKGAGYAVSQQGR